MEFVLFIITAFRDCVFVFPDLFAKVWVNYIPEGNYNNQSSSYVLCSRKD